MFNDLKDLKIEMQETTSNMKIIMARGNFKHMPNVEPIVNHTIERTRLCPPCVQHPPHYRCKNILATSLNYSGTNKSVPVSSHR